MEAQAAPDTKREDLESAASDELEALSPPDGSTSAVLSVKAIGLVVMLLSIAIFIVMMVVTHRKKQGEKQGVVMPSKKTSKKIMKK